MSIQKTVLLIVNMEFCLHIQRHDYSNGPVEGRFPLKLSSTVNVLQGGSVTLSCKYNGSAASDELLWYRQYSRSRPEFLILVNELTAKVEKNSKVLTLIIYHTAVSDSALYYCALTPTVTGNPPNTVLKLLL
uniref:Ig-like domain-containing protein n=1 Tax=Astyanax mexicanus TaxID=7994 RepID=A0A8B9JKD6_ASTMX